MNNTSISQLFMTPLSKKSSQFQQLQYYSPSPVKMASAQSSPYSSASQSPSDQIELLRILRQSTMNPQEKDEKFLQNQEAEMLDFIQELEEMNLQSNSSPAITI